MGASNHVGRVGGLAVALGVGAAVFAGTGAAWADAGGDAADPGPSSSQPAGRGAKAAPGSPASKAASTNNSRPAAAVAVRVPKALSSPAPRATIPSVSVPASAPASSPVQAPVAAAPAAVAAAPAESRPAPAAAVIGRAATVLPAPAPAIASAVAAGSGGVTGGAAPGAPTTVDSPLLAALIEVSRRLTPAAAATANQTAAVTSSAVTNNGVTVNPGVTYLDGIIQGNLNAVSASGQDLVFKFVDSSNGGKLDLGNVPTTLNPLLPVGSKGGAQSFTALPYATWINPASPTQSPVPTGTQTFDVRVTENTKFDQFIVKIPLVGMLAEPIISLLQQTPFASKLLAPIIGGSVLAQISTDMSALVPAGKAVAYTYKVTSFDGTEISTNFFPATSTSLYPGNFGASLFNGPGLGAAGTTDPYGAYQAAGSTPGLATLRGQGLPTGSGFNVVTWDPRGEYASGGILQLDNPFYEGRDVSALIDWSLANTGTLQPGGSPLIGMIGGSYGGGIQMTTVDPRIQAIVPAIAWNSLNESLYPSKVFKTAWSNALAVALLQAGARLNTQIPIGILTGNLFGFLTESNQAALGSSGPTALLTKLNVPALFVQGTVDALFPLQQAVANVQTMLEQNPYFSGANANKVKMIWFCGGHGVCLDPVDQSAQATSIFTQDMTWLNYYIKGAPVDINQIPRFQWWDQAGSHFVAATMPFEGSFGSGVVSATSTGGRVAILPYAIGGSGPNKTNCDYAAACEFPLAQTFATKAKNALNVDITVPLKDTEIVGAPTVSFTYSGWGNSKAVYGQIVDNATGRVLGNIATPIPVTLDGKSHTVTASIADIAYTAQTANSSLTLQIVGSATEYQNTRFGSVKLSNVMVDLPKTTAGTKV
jgi:ABC-2 type transport system ATP-binding protein